MGRLTENLETICREEPDTFRNVLVILSEQSRELKVSELGIDDVQEIPGLLGIFKGCLPGAKILELISRDEIDEISEDLEVEISS